jgi:pimeloyl-ACP methyl ester carboxylesterase
MIATHLNVHGVRLEVQLYPALTDAYQAPIVLLHEGLGSVAMWRDFPAQLHAATGRAVWVYSRRGYGQSSAVRDVRGAGRLQPDYMHHEAWQVLPELLRQCQISQPVLLGHSDGGTIALLHAARHAVSGCIVMAPHLFVEALSLQSIRAAREAFEHGDLRTRLAKYHADVDGAFWQWNEVWLSEAFRSFNIEAQCRNISAPLLAIQGHDDPYEWPFSAKSGYSPGQNKDCLLLKLEHCGHSPHRDQTQTVLAAITQWLAQISPGP